MDISQFDEHHYKRRLPDMVSIEPPKHKAKYGKGVPKLSSGTQYQKDMLEYLDTDRDTAMKFQYADGTKRKFGQKYRIEAYQDCLVTNKKNQNFIYEGPRDPKNRRNQSKQRDDTRSLYDDPKLQRLRQNNLTRKMIKNVTNEGQELPEQNQWEPLLNASQIPESYYMNAKFRETYGPQNLDPSRVKSEYDSFKLFYNEDIYELIIKNTEIRCGEKFLDQCYSYCHGYKKSKPINVEWKIHERELDGFFAIQLFFGLVRLSNQGDYWYQNRKSAPKNRSSQNLESRVKIQNNNNKRRDIYAHYVQQKMATIMSFERFKEIKRSLNISGGSAKESEKHDPIWKVRVFLNKMNELFSKYYKPDEYLTIDEGMIPFNGKVHFKVFNPDKPTKWGIKEYLLCDAVKCYTFGVRLYHGQTCWDADFKQNDLIHDEDTTSKTMELVLNMLKPFEKKSHKVIMDNYYTSWQLFRELKNRGIGALGTIRHNRTGLTKADIVSNHFQYIYKEAYLCHASYINKSTDCILLYFQGTSDKEVALISNYLDNSLNDQHKFNISKNHLQQPHPKQPYMIYIYNKYRGGVDRRNAFVVSYRSKFPVRKWWQSVFERVFETAMLNAFLIFKNLNPGLMYTRKGLMRDFRINVMYILAERFKEYDRDVYEGRQIKQRNIRKLDQHTFLQGQKKTRCVECGRKTKTFCQECTILFQEVKGFCDQDINIRCQRFHEFGQFNLDRNKIGLIYCQNIEVVDTKFKMDIYEIKKEIKLLYSKQEQLKQARTGLLAQQFRKKERFENLSQIENLLKKDDVMKYQGLLQQKIKGQISQPFFQEDQSLESSESSIKLTRQQESHSESRYRYSTEFECEVNTDSDFPGSMIDIDALMSSSKLHPIDNLSIDLGEGLTVLYSDLQSPSNSLLPNKQSSNELQFLLSESDQSSSFEKFESPLTKKSQSTLSKPAQLPSRQPLQSLTPKPSLYRSEKSQSASDHYDQDLKKITSDDNENDDCYYFNDEDYQERTYKRMQQNYLREKSLSLLSQVEKKKTKAKQKTDFLKTFFGCIQRDIPHQSKNTKLETIGQLYQLWKDI